MLVLLVGLTSGVATVDAELMREWTGQASVEVPQVIRLLGEEFIVSTALLQGKIGATGEPTWSRAGPGYATALARPGMRHPGQRMSEEDGETLEQFIHASA